MLAATLLPGLAGCSLIESDPAPTPELSDLVCEPTDERGGCIIDGGSQKFCHPVARIWMTADCCLDADCCPGGDNCGRTCNSQFRCVEATCSEDSDCDEGKYCDPTTLQCLFGCRAESCRENQYCYHGSTPRECRDRGCSGDGECDPDEYCDIAPVEPAQYEEVVVEGGPPPESDDGGGEGEGEGEGGDGDDGGEGEGEGEGEVDPPSGGDEVVERVRVVVGTCRFGCRAGEADACQRGDFCDEISHRCGPLSCASGAQACAPMEALGPDPDCDLDTEICDQPVYCDPETLKCRFGCIGAMWADEDPAPCVDPETQYCSIESPRRRCRPRTCARDADCSRYDTFCDIPRGEDVGVCRRGCRPGHCPNPVTDKCDVLTRKCEFTGCDANADCDDCLETGECVGEPPHYCDTRARQCRQGCRDSTDCDAGRTCDLSTRDCVGDPCPNGDIDCLPGEYCAGDFGTRRCEPGCRLDDPDTCPALQPCRPSDHQCGCDANPAVCAEGRRCVSNECVVTCDRDADCRELGLVCDGAVGQCVPGCADDGFEDRGEVIELDALEEEDQAILDEGLALCDDDVDWYVVTLEAGQSLRARIEFDHPTGNLDLFLYAPSDDVDVSLIDHCAPRADGLRRCSRGRAGFEELWVPGALEAGRWTLAVRRNDPRAEIEASPRAAYSLQVTRGVPPGECVEDDLEEGALGLNDERATASLIEPGDWDDLKLCEQASDWYVVFLADDDVMTATIRFEHASSDLDLALYAASDEFPEAIATSECDHLSCDDPDVEEVSVGPIPAGYSGLYALRVWSNSPGVPAEYSLEVAVDRVGEGCEINDEAVEPNDGRQTATRVGAGDVEGGICPAGEEDWYLVEVPARGSVRATMTYESDRGFPRFDMRLLTADGFPLRSDVGAHANKVVAAGGHPEAAAYYLQVSPGTESSVGPYQLAMEVAPPPPCEDDDREENDDLATARAIQAGQVPNQELCPWDEDWFEFPANALDDVSVQLIYDAAVDFRVQLLDPQGAPLEGCVDRIAAEAPVAREDCTSDEGDGTERVEVADLAAGRYVIRVWAADDGFASDVGAYHLDVDVTEEPCDRDDDDLEHDVYEAEDGNDIRPRAVVLDPGLHNGLTLCRADEDWYRVDVPPGQELRVLMSFSDRDGDLDMSLHDSDGEVFETCGDDGRAACVAVADAPTDLIFQRDQGGLDVPAYVRVYGGQPVDPNSYALTIELNDAVEPPDEGEEGEGEAQ